MPETPSTPRPAPTAKPAPGMRPLWIPPGVRFDKLSAELQEAITAIINPAYEKLVAGGQTPLEQGQGWSYVSLMWWELLEQLKMGEEWAQTLTQPTAASEKAGRARLKKLLKLIAAKDKIARFLKAIDDFFERAGDIDPLGRMPR
jgi:hypothetical protein